MKIAILDDYTNTVGSLAAFAKLAGHDVTIWHDHCQDPEVLAARLAGVEALALLRERTQITAGLLDRLPDLRLISMRGAYPHIDVAATTRAGVILSSKMGGAGGAGSTTAELTWGLIIAALRQIPQQVAALKAGHWQTAPGYTMHGKTVGIFGYGRIGKEIARFAQAFGMKPVVWGGEGSRTRAAADGIETAPDKASFFAEADVLSLHLRLSDSTRGIVTGEDLARMKPTALIVNTGRAELIAPGALVAALQSGRPGMAAVDVYDSEPLTDVADPLLNMPNALCTPHIGYVTLEDLEAQFGVIFDQILAYAAGRPVEVQNPEVLADRTSTRSGGNG